MNVALENLNNKNRKRPISARPGRPFHGKSIPELQEEYKNYNPTNTLKQRDSMTVTQTDDCVNIVKCASELQRSSAGLRSN